MSNTITVADAAEEFLTDAAERVNLSGRRRRSPTTVREYRRHLGRWLDVPFFRDGEQVTLGELPLLDVDTDTLRSLMQVVADTPTRYGREPAPFTVRNVANSFGSLFDWAGVRYGLRGYTSPTRGLDLGRRVLDGAVRPVKQAVYLDGAGADQIAEEAGPKYEPLLRFINATGARSGEARGVRWGDIHLDAPVPFVRLTVQADDNGEMLPALKHRAVGEFRDVPLPPDQVERLRTLAEEWRKRSLQPEGERLVYPTVHGNPRKGGNLVKAVRLIAERLGLGEVTPHALRDAYARRLLARGIDIATISKLIGHKSVQVTVEAYLDADPPLAVKAEAVTLAFSQPAGPDEIRAVA